MSHVLFTLPWPPSANHAWRSVGSKVLRSREYRSYKKAVFDTVFEQHIRRHWTKARLSILVELHPPNNRSYDIDNRLKTLLDCLTHAGIIEDDRFIDSILVTRAQKDSPAGSVRVRIDEVLTDHPTIYETEKETHQHTVA